MKKWIIGIVALTILALVLPGAAVAQAPEGCADTYIVQPGDTLALIAGQLLDNPWAYPALVFATNQAAADREDLTAIADPNLIEVGDKLCIPTDETVVDVQTLKNLSYLSDFTQKGTAPLVNGVYSESAAPGSATKTVIRLHDRMAFGYSAGGQPFAAVILVSDPGGSGTFYDLAFVALEKGEPRHVASTLLGDRVQIQSLSVEGGEIVVEMIAHAADDPMCCPTQHTVARYALQEDELVQTSVKAEGETPGLIDVVWEWERFVGGDDSVIEVDDPSKYTLTLTADGTYQVVADCNRAGGGYTLEASLLTLLPGPMTLAECGPDSLYDEFVRKLGDVRTYVRPGGSDQLVLNLFADAGNMYLRPKPAQLPETVVDKVWQWTYTLNADGQTETEVENPEQYTLTYQADGMFLVQADCNRGRGTYGLSDGLAMALGAMTRAACGPDSHYQAFVDALGAVQDFELDADEDEFRLELEDGGGTMVFQAAPQATMERALEGTSWTLASYDDGSSDLASVLEGTEITADFVEGQLAGSAGCNNYFASYTLDGTTLTVGPAGSTRKMCGTPKGIMEQEQAYLTILDAVAGYRTQGSQVELLDVDGAVVATFVVQE